MAFYEYFETNSLIYRQRYLYIYNCMIITIECHTSNVVSRKIKETLPVSANKLIFLDDPMNGITK